MEPGEIMKIRYARASTADPHFRMRQDALKSTDYKEIYTVCVR